MKREYSETFDRLLAEFEIRGSKLDQVYGHRVAQAFLSSLR